MKIKELASYNTVEIESLLSRIPFFKELNSKTSKPLDVFLQHSCIVELEPGETIMRRGERGTWLYFLVKGRLDVFHDSEHGESPISAITPGELFGDLAILCNQERKATVVAEKGGKACQLFATDFRLFGDLTNFHTIDLPTKLLFYRTIVHSIRWRLEVKKMEDSSHPFVQELRKVPVYSGEKEGEKELLALFEQSRYLADILDRWNGGCGLVQDVASVAQT